MNTKLDLKYLGKPIKITGYNFAKPVLKLFNDIKFPDRTLRLAGTAGFKVLSLFASDIDLFQLLSQQDISHFATHISHLAKQMHPSEQPNHAVFVELKSGGKHYSRNQLINLSDQLKKEIERNIKRDPFNKVDLIFYDGKTYEEITIVYQFEEFADASNPSIRDNLLNDFNHYIKSGNLYKASKRMHNIKRLEGNLPNSPALQYLESIITNPILSTINQAITQLETYQRVPVKFRHQSALEYIKQRVAKVLNSSTARLLNNHIQVNTNKSIQLAINLLNRNLKQLSKNLINLKLKP